MKSIEVIEKYLTFDYKVNIDDSLRSFNTFEYVFYNKIKNFKPDGKENKNRYYVGRFIYGKPFIKKNINFDEKIIESYSEVYISDSLKNTILEKYKKEKRKNEIWKTFVYQYMESLTSQELNNILIQCHDLCSHIAPLRYYVEDKLFCTFSKYNNLTKNEKIFKSHMNKKVKQWDLDILLFIFSFFHLSKSGNFSILEEFNNCQLTPTSLYAFLKKTTNYNTENNPKRFFDLVSYSKTYRKALHNKFITYRDINGITHLKKLKYIPKKYKSYDQNELEFFFDTKVKTLKDINSFVYGLTIEEVKQLIINILNVLVTKTESDFSTSRTIKDFSSFVNMINQKDIKLLISKNKLFYYNFTVYNKNKNLNNLNNKIKTINTRMNYNSWHYMPSNFLNFKDYEFESRDYYFAPLIGDISNYSDYHYKGHKLIGAKANIRTVASIKIQGYVINAFCDLRLSKNTGKYTESDLILTNRYLNYIQKINESLLEMAKKSQDILLE
jgi:hypothetical protein